MSALLLQLAVRVEFGKDFFALTNWALKWIWYEENCDDLDREGWSEKHSNLFILLAIDKNLKLCNLVEMNEHESTEHISKMLTKSWAMAKVFLF